MNRYNMVKIAVGYGATEVANCEKNAIELMRIIRLHKTADIIVLPELAITGYTCKDLFNQSQLLDNAANWAMRLAYMTCETNSLIFFGCPVRVGKSLYNCAMVAHKGNLIGIVPKQNLPNYKEFEEERWFKAGDGTEPEIISFNGNKTPFGIDLIFEDINKPDFRVGCEICEDVLMPIAPSSLQAEYGDATILVNLSASNETVAKADYRKMLVEMTSGKNIAAYAYASCGNTESTADVVFSGDCIIAENGSTIAQTTMYQDSDTKCADIDLEKLMNERRRTGSFGKNKNRFNVSFRTINFEAACYMTVSTKENYNGFTLDNKINKFPFVPSDPATLAKRCTEIFNIQVAGLVKRMKRLGPNGNYQIGISGGLDSTLALLVAVKACEKLGWPTDVITGTTMPGFGTSNKTKNNAIELMKLTGVKPEMIDICEISLEMFRNIDHLPFGISCNIPSAHSFKEKLSEVPVGCKDLVFQNVQARARTFTLMSKGFVIGTGDMSELALGWCTFNGDHMSMYNPNCSIPKTLVKWLVKYVAENLVDEPTKIVLLDIVDTLISPELMPLGKDGEIIHSTEDEIGPYELHDFFLFNFVRNGFAPEKIFFLAEHAFAEYSKTIIKKWLKLFLTNFFIAQFKRNCVPDGPKVGSVSLSPRGDWRMPSDACVDEWIKNLENA